MMQFNADSLLRRYDEAKSARMPVENDMRQGAQYCFPQMLARWEQIGGGQPQVMNTDNSRRRSYDATAQKALIKWAMILERTCTPRTIRWHGLKASDPALNKIRSVKEYFEQVTDILFSLRYHAHAGFVDAQEAVYLSLGAMGNGIKYINPRKITPVSPSRGFHYRACGLHNFWFLTNDEGRVDTCFKRTDLTVRQFQQKFPDIPQEAYPPQILMEAKLDRPSDVKTFEIVHIVAPRDDYDSKSFGSQRFPWGSAYVAVADRVMVGNAGGFRRTPYIVSRYFRGPDDLYGQGPAQQVNASSGMVQAMKKTTLKQGQKAADPPILAHDDGVVQGGVDIRPGAVNPGTVTKEGKPLLLPMNTGASFEIAKELIADERLDINDAFFVTLFQVLQENPDMKATTAMELAGEKAAILAPTMGKIQGDDIGPTVERELDVADALGLLPEMPPELIEARGDYELEYTSPLARSMRMEEVNGFTKLTGFVGEIAQLTGNPRIMRRLNFDTAIPEIAERMAVPTGWLTPDDQMEAMEEQDEQAVEVQQLADTAPAIAGMAKAASTMANRAPKGGQ